MHKSFFKLFFVVLLNISFIYGVQTTYDSFWGKLPFNKYNGSAPANFKIESLLKSSSLSDLRELAQLQPVQRDLTQRVETMLGGYQIPLNGCRGFKDPGSGFSVTILKTIFVGSRKYANIYFIHNPGEHDSWFAYSKENGALGSIDLDNGGEYVTVCIPMGQTKFFVELSFGE